MRKVFAIRNDMSEDHFGFNNEVYLHHDFLIGGLKDGDDGIFVDAQRHWGDTDLLEIPAKTVDEPRSLVIGRIGSNYWSAVITVYSSEVCHPNHVKPAT